MNVDKTAHLPTAVYRLYDADGRLIYIGQSQRMGQRMRGHMLNSWFYELVDSIELEYYPTRPAAVAAETLAIQEMQPAFNVMCTTDGPIPTDADLAIAFRWRFEEGRLLGMTVMNLVNERVRGIDRWSRGWAAA